MVSSQNAVNFDVNLSGMLEAAFPIIPGAGVLKNQFVVVDGPGALDLKVSYTIVSATAGPFLGLQQAFDLDPNTAVRMQFDRAIVRKEQVQVGTRQEQIDTKTVCVILIFICHEEPVFATVPIFETQSVRYDDGLIEFFLGEKPELMFEDVIGQLLDYDYFLADPTLRNKTSMTLGGQVGFKAACLAIPLVGEGCMVDKTAQASIPVLTLFDETWTLPDFADVQGAGVHRFSTSVPSSGTLSLILAGALSTLIGSRRRPAKIY